MRINHAKWFKHMANNMKVPLIRWTKSLLIPGLLILEDLDLEINIYSKEWRLWEHTFYHGLWSGRLEIGSRCMCFSI